MKLKIYYRSPVVWNLILFVLFSVFFLLLQEVYINISSIKNKILVMNFVTEKIYFLGICFGTIFSLFTMRKISKFFMVLTIIMTTVHTCFNLNQEFSKIILVILFFYLLISYYLYQFFIFDLEESFYNPQFNVNSLFSPMLQKIECEVQSTKKNELKSTGFLTNWSQEGCFIYLEEPMNLGSSIDVTIKFGGKEFKQSGVVASKFSKNLGYGVKFSSKTNTKNSDIMNWWDFYNIMEQMGLKSELLI